MLTITERVFANGKEMAQLQSTSTRNNRVTIKDVAKLADVTAQTVSRVMRNSGYVSEETRAKVLEAVHELNYIPNYAGKALRNGMSRSIAIVFDNLRNFYFSVMIDYLRKSIISHGFSIQLLFSNENVITEHVYRKAISHGAVGVISFLEGEQGIGDSVKKFGVPLMVFGRSTDDEGVDYITTDDVQGGSLAAKKLLSVGCTSFRYLVEGLGMTCAIARYRGFADTLSEYGYSVEVIDADDSEKIEFSRLQLDDPQCGVFCFCDAIAFEVMKRMKDIPENRRAKLIGYDNLQTDVSLPMSLTSIGLDKEKHAEFTVKKMIERIDNSAGRISAHCSVCLIEGDTT